MVTVTRVDEATDLITGFDGMSVPRDGDLNAPKIVIPLHDILKVRDKVANWIEFPAYSLRIGRIFQDISSSTNSKRLKSPQEIVKGLYKVLFIRYKVETKQWLVVDTELKEHHLTVMEVGRQLLPPRSLSIAKRQIYYAYDYKISEEETYLMKLEDTRLDDINEATKVG